MLSQLAPNFVGQAIKVGKGILAPKLLTAAVIGSVIGLNFVGKSDNSSFIAVDFPVLTPAVAWDTGSGGQAKYDTITMQSPFKSGSTANGLKTGTGLVWLACLNIVSNPTGASIDCTTVAGPLTATGGTSMITNASATGSTTCYNTPFTLGPTQRIKCGTTGTPGASFSGSIRALMSGTDVIN